MRVLDSESSREAEAERERGCCVTELDALIVSLLDTVFDCSAESVLLRGKLSVGLCDSDSLRDGVPFECDIDPVGDTVRLEDVVRETVKNSETV